MASKKKPDDDSPEVDDCGCIFEIDLTQGKKVAKILNELQIKHIQKLYEKKKTAKLDSMQSEIKVESMEG
jgi:hypothetical protein